MNFLLILKILLRAHKIKIYWDNVSELILEISIIFSIHIPGRIF